MTLSVDPVVVAFKGYFDAVRTQVDPRTLPPDFAVTRWSAITAADRATAGIAIGSSATSAYYVAPLSTPSCARFILPDLGASVDEFIAIHETGHAHEDYSDRARFEHAPFAPRALEVAWSARGFPRNLADQWAIHNRVSGVGSPSPATSPKEWYADAFARAFATDPVLRTNDERLIAWNADIAAGTAPWDGARMRTLFRWLPMTPETLTHAVDPDAAAKAALDRDIKAFWVRTDLPDWFRTWAANYQRWLDTYVPRRTA